MRTPWMSTVIDPTSAITYTVIGGRACGGHGDFKATFRTRDDYSPGVRRNRGCAAVALASAQKVTTRLFHPWLPGLALAQDPRLRGRASVRLDRAARHPDEHGSNQGTGACDRAYRRRQTPAHRARALRVVPRRVGADARYGPGQARGAARRGAPLHRSGPR